MPEVCLLGIHEGMACSWAALVPALWNCTPIKLAGRKTCKEGPRPGAWGHLIVPSSLPHLRGHASWGGAGRVAVCRTDPACSAKSASTSSGDRDWPRSQGPQGSHPAGGLGQMVGKGQ